MEGKARDLNRGSHEAFRALINSIAPVGANEQGNLTPETIEKLSAKLNELVGEDAVKDFQRSRNETGELVNEEGLPIIEISESAEAADGVGTGNTLISDENPLIPLTQLGPTSRQRLRQQRDHILDILEEEEHQGQLKEAQREKEEHEETLKKRREAAANEKKNLLAAKELHKKMGKALFQDENKEEKLEGATDTSSGKKKSVAFADDTKVKASSKVDWGDVAPARLRPAKRPTLLQDPADTHTMKMNVVERIPSRPSIQEGKISMEVEQDSDDESEPDHSEHDDEELEHEPLDSEDEAEGDTKLDKDEMDFDFAQHQREVAMEYYKKRAEIGGAATEAMVSHSHDEDGEVVPTGISTSEPTKPSISRFRASKLASAYGSTASPASMSLEGSVVSESTARTLQRAVRTGKVNDENRLIGGDGESASEDENEGIQEVLELLRKGEVYNLGSDGIHTVKPTETLPPRPSTSAEQNPDSVVVPEAESTRKAFPPLQRPKVSRFKADRLHVVRSPISSVNTSAASTPVSEALRSSPKLAPDVVSGNSTPTMSPGIVERKPTPITSSVIERNAKSTPTMSPGIVERKPAPVTSSVIERNSRPMVPSVLERKASAVASAVKERPQLSSSSVRERNIPIGEKHQRTQPAMQNNVNEFTLPQNPSSTSSPFSMIVESPSFPARRPGQQPPALIPTGSARRTPKPPTVMSSKVQETRSTKPVEK